VSRGPALLIAIIGGAVLGYFLFLIAAGAVLGFLWLYVFGDDPWPEWSNYVLGGAIVAGAIASWFFCARLIWRHLRPRTD
jgi:hypothetical protein